MGVLDSRSGCGDCLSLAGGRGIGEQPSRRTPEEAAVLMCPWAFGVTGSEEFRGNFVTLGTKFGCKIMLLLGSKQLFRVCSNSGLVGAPLPQVETAGTADCDGHVPHKGSYMFNCEFWEVNHGCLYYL